MQSEDYYLLPVDKFIELRESGKLPGEYYEDLIPFDPTQDHPELLNQVRWDDANL